MIKKVTYILTITLIIFTLSACRSSNFNTKVDNEEPNFPEIKQETSKKDAEPKKAKAIIFDVNVSDPQELGIYNGTDTFKMELYETAENTFEGSLHLVRDFVSNTEFLDGKMKYSYSVKKLQAELGDPAMMKEKYPLKGKSAAGEFTVPEPTFDNNNRLEARGILKCNGRYEIDTTMLLDDFLPENSSKKGGMYTEYPYILSVQGNKAKMFVFIHEKASLSFAGEVIEEVMPASLQSSQLITAASDTNWLIYANDIYSIDIESAIMAQYWITLIAEKKDGKDPYGTYKGKIYIVSLEGANASEKGINTMGRPNADYLGDIEFKIEPFDVDRYNIFMGNNEHPAKLEDYTGMALFNTPLSGRGSVNALTEGGELPISIVVSGNDVRVELPTSRMKEGFYGELKNDPSTFVSMRLEADDSIYMSRLISGFYIKQGGVNKPVNMRAFDPSEYGFDITSSDISLMVGAWTEGSDLADWYPKEKMPKYNISNFLPKIAKNPVIGAQGDMCIQLYVEDDDIDVVMPEYRKVLEKQKNYKELKYCETEAYYYDTSFEIGKYDVKVLVEKSPLGTAIMVKIQD